MVARLHQPLHAGLRTLLLLLLCGGPGSFLRAGVNAQTSPQQQLVEVAQFGWLGYCPATDPETYPFPVITDSFCDTLGLTVPNNDKACEAFNMLEALLVTPTGNPLNCRIIAPEEEEEMMPKRTDSKGRYIPQALPDRRVDGVMSPTLPFKSVMDIEGGTMNWLFKTLSRFAGFSPCEALGTKTTWLKPKDWVLLKIINLEEDLSNYGLSATSIPLVAVLKQRSAQARSVGCQDLVQSSSGNTQLCKGGHLMILVRGSLTAAEKKIDFSYKMKADPAYGPGLVHEGFRSAANQMWKGGLKQVLDQEIVNGNGTVRHITIAGQSLGAGVATLLSARAQRYLEPKLRSSRAWRQWPNRQPLITAVLFASPNAGSAPFVTAFNSRVNVRNIAFANDLIPQVPCTPKVTACPNAAVPTGTAAGFWPYGKVGGVLRFSGADMPFQIRAWQQMTTYTQHIFCDNMLSINALNKAAHICSYLCMTSSYVKDRQNWCLLWPAEGDEAEGAVFCMEKSGRDPFPTNPLFPVKPAP